MSEKEKNLNVNENVKTINFNVMSTGGLSMCSSKNHQKVSFKVLDSGAADAAKTANA